MLLHCRQAIHTPLQLTGLTAGKSQAIYPYAMNGDGESKSIDPTIFMTGIPGKNAGDEDIVYQDLESCHRQWRNLYIS
jgi:hypothetical protein